MGYQNDWSGEERDLYDECYRAGQQWAGAQDTPADQVQRLMDLSGTDDEVSADVELDYPPLIEAVAAVTGNVVAGVPASHDDAAFCGFVEGVRDTMTGDMYAG